MNKAKVGIVVVTYNRLALLQEEIEALRKQTYKEFQIVVVNNSSTDGTLEWLKGQNDIITITQGNVGGAGGFYTGMKYVAENGYDYCWVMDDDVICHTDALEHLIAAYAKHPDAGYVCSKVVGIDGSAMNVPILDMRKGNCDYASWYEESGDSILRIKKSTFVSAMFPTSIIREVGLPYKEYFIWGDDWEYTQRVSTSHVSYLALNSAVVHKRIIQKGMSLKYETDKKRIRMKFYAFRNLAYNYLKFGEKSKFRTMLTACKESLSFLVHGRFYYWWIYQKAMLSLLTFHPSIDYPKRKN